MRITLHMIWLCSIISCNTFSISNGEESLIIQQLAKCELEALKLGTDMADIINSPLGSEGWSERVNQDFVVKHLGFAPFMSKGVRGKGQTYTKNDAKTIQESGNWTGKSIEDSPYQTLNHKWIYMFGDSTSRQVWASFAAPFQANNFERNSKEWTRQYCAGQGKYRLSHGKQGVFPNEGWRGVCGRNEVTCHVSGYGSEGLLTYDWKHFPYEDYDEYLWSDRGPWKNAVEERRPDILTVQFGLHTCWHSHINTPADNDLSIANNSMIDRHIAGISKLMSSIRAAIDRPGENRTQAVVIVTSGASGTANGSLVDECILRVNRVAADEAHKHGFAVLERGEIERRLMHKSRGSENPLIKVEMHLVQPTQSMVATCLLKLLSCLDTAGYNIYSPDVPSLLNIKANTQADGAGILHVPP